MKPYELFNHIWNIKYNKNGFDLDWQIELDAAEKKVRLLFQPSISVKDWVIDFVGFFPIIKKPFLYCWGWSLVFSQCQELIFLQLMQFYNAHQDFTVEICGHSYGGSVAIIAGLELYKKHKIKADVVTFGAPMPLFLRRSKKIARECLGNVIQYAHKSDCVAVCPPFPGYHNLNVKWVGKFNFFHWCNPLKYHMLYGQKELYQDSDLE